MWKYRRKRKKRKAQHLSRAFFVFHYACFRSLEHHFKISLKEMVFKFIAHENRILQIALGC